VNCIYARFFQSKSSSRTGSHQTHLVFSKRCLKTRFRNSGPSKKKWLLCVLYRRLHFKNGPIENHHEGGNVRTQSRLKKTSNARLAAVLALPTLCGSSEAQAASKAAVFDFQFVNLGQLEPTQADKDRLPRLSDELRTLLAKSGVYDIVPVSSYKTAIDKGAPLRNCGGCAIDYAQKLGAQFAITGEIQKVSNLILNINVYIADVSGATPEKAFSVDIRGDTDESFDRGVKYIVKNNILNE
jgi:hypothetical protein